MEVVAGEDLVNFVRPCLMEIPPANPALPPASRVS